MKFPMIRYHLLRFESKAISEYELSEALGVYRPHPLQDALARNFFVTRQQVALAKVVTHALTLVPR